MANIKTITDINGNTYDILDAGAQRTLVSGTNIKTINGQSVLGSGDLSVDGDVTGIKGNSESAYRTGNVNLTLANLGVHISTSDPTSSDGNNGDIWIKYTASE
jgi:hypothetical protein